MSEPTPEQLGSELKSYPFPLSLFLKPKLDLIDTLKHNDEDSYILDTHGQVGHIDFIMAEDMVLRRFKQHGKEVCSNKLFSDEQHPIGLRLRWKINGKWEGANIALSPEHANRLFDDLKRALENTSNRPQEAKTE
jgi:hypothetical protein